MWTVIKRKPIWNSKVFREVGICCQEARPCCIVPWLFLVNRWTALSVLWPKCTLGFHDRGGNWGVPVFQGSRPGNEVLNLRWKFRVKKTKKNRSNNKTQQQQQQQQHSYIDWAVRWPTVEFFPTKEETKDIWLSQRLHWDVSDLQLILTRVYTGQEQYQCVLPESLHTCKLSACPTPTGRTTCFNFWTTIKSCFCSCLFECWGSIGPTTIDIPVTLIVLSDEPLNNQSPLIQRVHTGPWQIVRLKSWTL